MEYTLFSETRTHAGKEQGCAGKREAQNSGQWFLLRLGQKEGGERLGARGESRCFKPHTCTHARTHTHVCILTHACTHVHTRAHTLQHTGRMLTKRVLSTRVYHFTLNTFCVLATFTI